MLYWWRKIPGTSSYTWLEPLTFRMPAAEWLSHGFEGIQTHKSLTVQASSSSKVLTRVWNTRVQFNLQIHTVGWIMVCRKISVKLYLPVGRVDTNIHFHEVQIQIQIYWPRASETGNFLTFSGVSQVTSTPRPRRPLSLKQQLQVNRSFI